MHFGDYICKLRLAADFSLTDAARDLGMSPQRLCDMEQGRRVFKHPPLELLRNISAIYKHPFASIVANTEFFQYEKQIVSALLSDLDPLTRELEQKAVAMLVESRQYTPEMEALCSEAVALTQALKMALMLAKTRFSKAPRKSSSALSPTKKAG